jgi:peptide/nickel transport system permease protein
MVLAIAIVGVLGPNLTNATLAISVVAMPQFARLVRGQVLSLREMEFVQAAWAVGAPVGRILRRHLLPNLLGLVVIQGTLTVSFAILTEATLSFLGLGVQPPTASWGNMLSDAETTGFQAWWFYIFPMLFLLATTLAFNLLGDAIRDALDPRTERIFAGRRKKKQPA